MLGLPDWNTLSARIQAGRQTPAAATTQTDLATGRYPALPLRDLVPFPGATYPLFVGRAKTVGALEQAFRRQREVVIAIQRSSAVDEPGVDDVYEIGVIAGVVDLANLPDGTRKVLTQIHRRVAIRGFVGDEGGYIAEIEHLSAGPIPDAPDLIRTAIAHFAAYAERHAIPLPRALQLPTDEVRAPVLVPDIVSGQIRDPGRLADIIGTHIKLDIPSKQALLGTLDPVARLERVDALLLADQPG